MGSALKASFSSQLSAIADLENDAAGLRNKN
jgi:hypothetical protein